MAKHTEGPLTFFVGNSDGRGLIRIESSIDAPIAGAHIASMPRGEKSEANADELVRRWNAHEALVEALKDAAFHLYTLQDASRIREIAKAALKLYEKEQQ